MNGCGYTVMSTDMRYLIHRLYRDHLLYSRSIEDAACHSCTSDKFCGIEDVGRDVYKADATVMALP